MFCDFSKSFNVVQHSTLVMKLHHYVIRGRAIKLLTSFLTDGVQRVDVNVKKSSGSVISKEFHRGLFKVLFSFNLI